jgi:hypothetical protein
LVPVPTEADLLLHLDVTVSDKLAKMITAPDAMEVMRFCFLAMFPSFFGVTSSTVNDAKR